MAKVFANVCFWDVFVIFWRQCFILQEMWGILHFVQFLDLCVKFWKKRQSFENLSSWKKLLYQSKPCLFNSINSLIWFDFYNRTKLTKLTLEILKHLLQKFTTVARYRVIIFTTTNNKWSKTWIWQPCSWTSTMVSFLFNVLSGFTTKLASTLNKKK